MAFKLSSGDVSGFKFLLSLAIMYGLMSVLVYSVVHMKFVKPLGIDAPLDRFSEARAMEHLRVLTKDIDGRQEGHPGLKEAALYIKSQLEMLKERAASNVRIDIEETVVDGSFNMIFLGHSISLGYRNHTNVIMRISSVDSQDTDTSVLLNGHYDGPLGSPGAGDCGSCVASMLEVARLTTDSGWVPPRPIIFLFNGAEELFMLGTHGFMKTHKWRDTIGAFINVEASGTGGVDLVCQSGPGSWPSLVYAQSAIYPMAHSAAQDVFPVIPGDTDYRIFAEDYGDIPGLDIIFLLGGYFYHTSYDTMERLLPGSIQARGENLFSVIKAFTNSSNLRNARERESLRVASNASKDERAVFFDYLAQFMIFYSRREAVVLHSIPMLIFFVMPFFLCLRNTGLQQLFATFCDFMKGMMFHLIGIILAIVIPILLSILRLMFSSHSMSWFNHPYLAFMMFIPCSLVGLLIPRIVWRHFPLSQDVAIRTTTKEALSDEARFWGAFGLYALLTLAYLVAGLSGGFLTFIWSASLLLAWIFFCLSIKMKQLAAGLKVLNEKHLIHRDLKPQNLLLSTNETSPLLKIGDFGFARYLKPQGLADTLCGSPLYMAPEIIQNLKYDAKADLWSVGAILFQLVIGKPPFEGNSQLQLFQNVLTSSELRFPKGALEVLHPDFVDLCRSLLRRNPVERLSFMEFFNHNFLAEPKLPVDVHQSSLVRQIKSPAELTGCLRDQSLPFAFNKRPQLLSEDPLISSESNPKLTSSSLHDDSKIISRHKDHRSTSSNRSFHVIMPNAACDELRKYDGGDLNSSDQLRVSDSMESIEKGYVLVNPHFASMGTFSSSVETSLLENSSTRVSIYPPRTNDQAIAVALQTKELIPVSLGGAGSLGGQSSNPSEAGESTILKEVQGPSILHPSTRLQLLHQYATTLSTLVQEKFNAGLFLESFSVELVVLALWKEILQVCSSWVSSTAENDVPGSCPPNKSTSPQEKAGSSSKLEENIDFDSPSSVFMWAEQGFISAFDRAEKFSDHLRKLDGNAEMPDAMEIIYQTALAVGKSGAVDEYFENKPSAAAAYAKAKLLLSFILREATSLPLNPPFSLTPAVKKQIQKYITKLEIHLTHSQLP